MEFKYTDYCTCFCTQEIKNEQRKTEVWIWDEIKDRCIQKIKIQGGEVEASKIMKEWQDKAPKHYICELI